jgi:hypothetical protein
LEIPGIPKIFLESVGVQTREENLLRIYAILFVTTCGVGLQVDAFCSYPGAKHFLSDSHCCKQATAQRSL